MRKKILLYYIILLIIGMSITGVFVTRLTQNLYKDDIRHLLLTVASLFEHELTQAYESGSPVDYNTLAITYAASLDKSTIEIGKGRSSGEAIAKSRITIIDYNGNVLGDSLADHSIMENHLGRKEVQQALQGKTGEDTRFSSTLRMDFLYIAIPSSRTNLVIRVSVPLVQIKKIYLQIWLYCIFGILAGLLLTTFLAFGFASTITKPVRELTYAAKEIAGGNYSKRVAEESYDELGQLAATFNEMVGKLDKTVADLIDKNMKFDAILNSMTNCFVAVDSKMRIILVNSIATSFFHLGDDSILGKKFIEVIRNHQMDKILQQTITSNTSSVSELSLSRPEEGIFRVYASPIKSADTNYNSGGIITLHDITNIKRLEQIRTEFVSNVTHELKTPLTSIKGFVETLRSGAFRNEDITAHFLEIIDIETERLTILINDILQLSEIENKLNDSNIDTHRLTDIIAEVISIVQSSAGKKNVNLIVEAVPEITIQANRDRIKQMLINLIDNAINYNVENGNVCIKAARADGRLVISVADTGIGIAQQHLSRIFERFYRVDKGRSRNVGGTGLGLSIVKHIVHLYDGDIKVESKPGKGTEFVIRLPV